MASATAATPSKLPNRDELAIEDILDSTNMSEGRQDVTSLRASIARAVARVPSGINFFDLPWFRVLAAQKTANSLISFQRDLQQSPVNLKSDDPALAPYDEWVRLMKETVDVAQQQMEAGQNTNKEVTKTRKVEEHHGLKKKVTTADEVEKAESKGMGKERRTKQEKFPPADSAANAQSPIHKTKMEKEVEGEVQTKAKARGKSSFGSSFAISFASPGFIDEIDESESVVEMGRRPEGKLQGKGRDGEKQRKPNPLGRKIAGAFAAGLGSDSEVQEGAEAEHSTLEREVPVARKKAGEAAAHFEGWRTIARVAEASMKARQQWPEPRTGKNVVVTKPICSIRTQKGIYKLEWPAKWGWGPLTDGTTNFIEA